MTDLTPERLQELRRIAEAATPGPEEIITPSHPVFDSTTVLALLDEIERLRREQENNVTRFALYDPDLNAWECQAADCRFWWEFESGDPYEHDMRFCPRCGRRIVAEVRDVEDGEAEDGENDA